MKKRLNPLKWGGFVWSQIYFVGFGVNNVLVGVLPHKKDLFNAVLGGILLGVGAANFMHHANDKQTKRRHQSDLDFERIKASLDTETRVRAEMARKRAPAAPKPADPGEYL